MSSRRWTRHSRDPRGQADWFRGAGCRRTRRRTLSWRASRLCGWSSRRRWPDGGTRSRCCRSCCWSRRNRSGWMRCRWGTRLRRNDWLSSGRGTDRLRSPGGRRRRSAWSCRARGNHSRSWHTRRRCSSRGRWHRGSGPSNPRRARRCRRAWNRNWSGRFRGGRSRSRGFHLGSRCGCCFRCFGGSFLGGQLLEVLPNQFRVLEV